MSGPILVFGAGGQLGREVLDLGRLGTKDVVGFERSQIDILDKEAVFSALDRLHPRLVVNAAAYTAVDRAESEPDKAFAVNGVGPGVIAEAADRLGTPVVHVSTDYVFDGQKDDAYLESDPISPLGVYGRSKAEGEARVRAATEKHVIIRTSWVYGVYGANFLKTMLRLARERDELRVVADQRGCPTATPDLAEAIFAVDRSIDSGGAPWGTFHFAGTGATTWYGFASKIVEVAGECLDVRPKVTAIATSDYPTPAKRPVNSELDSSHFSSVFGYRSQYWKSRTAEIVRALCDPALKETS